MNKVYATIIVGSRYEPHFAECLSSLSSCVDGAVVDINGENADNMRAIMESQLYKSGRLKYEFKPWENFAEARNHTFAMLPQDCTWVMRADCDEVHFPQYLQVITKTLLANLSPKVGMLDTYWLNFSHSFKYVLNIERRHDLIIRYHPGMHWSRAAHEQLSGRQGQRVAAPYIFHHYAYLTDPALVVAKECMYKNLSEDSKDNSPQAQALQHKQRTEACHLYRGAYPQIALKWLDIPSQAPQHLKDFETSMADKHLPPLPSLKNKARILFRMPALLAALTSWQAKKAAWNLSKQLSLVLDKQDSARPPLDTIYHQEDI